MGLYAQHGYGKGNKISKAIASNDLSGVILGPKGESPKKLMEFVRELNRLNSETKIYFDPQFHACYMQGEVVKGKLIEYPYYTDVLTRGQLSVSKNISKYASDVVDFQRGLGITAIFSPTIRFNNFTGSESQIAVSLAFESIDLTKEIDDLYITLYINEIAFKNNEAMEEFLNTISLMDVKGFYIVIERNGDLTKSTLMDEEILQNLIRFLYILAEINKYDVILGYSDLLSIPLSIVGNINFATGWFNNLRAYSEDNFRPASGGRRPRKRYSSGVLMSSLLLVPEVAALNKFGLWSEIKSSSPYDDLISQSSNDTVWTDEVSCLHNWFVLKTILKEINNRATIQSRIDFVAEKIKIAEGVYNKIKLANIPLEKKSNNAHLKVWYNAIKSFAEQIGYRIE